MRIDFKVPTPPIDSGGIGIADINNKASGGKSPDIKTRRAVKNEQNQKKAEKNVDQTPDQAVADGASNNQSFVSSIAPQQRAELFCELDKGLAKIKINPINLKNEIPAYSGVKIEEKKTELVKVMGTWAPEEKHIAEQKKTAGELTEAIFLHYYSRLMDGLEIRKTSDFDDVCNRSDFLCRVELEGGRWLYFAVDVTTDKRNKNNSYRDDLSEEEKERLREKQEYEALIRVGKGASVYFNDFRDDKSIVVGPLSYLPKLTLLIDKDLVDNLGGKYLAGDHSLDRKNVEEFFKELIAEIERQIKILETETTYCVITPDSAKMKSYDTSKIMPKVEALKEYLEKEKCKKGPAQ